MRFSTQFLLASHISGLSLFPSPFYPDTDSLSDKFPWLCFFFFSRKKIKKQNKTKTAETTSENVNTNGWLSFFCRTFPDLLCSSTLR